MNQREGWISEVQTELRRLGFEEDDLPTILLPEGISPDEFLDKLGDIPTWQGDAGFDELMQQLLGSQRAPWDEWPDPGDRFSAADLVGALHRRGVADAERRAKDYERPPRQFPTWLLAALSLTSEQLNKKVHEYLAEVRLARLRHGVDPEVIDTAEDRFSEARRRMSIEMAAIEEARRDSDGPAILFRLVPDLDDQVVREFVFNTVRTRCAPQGVWMQDGPNGETWVCLLMPKSKAGQCPHIRRWLGTHAIVLETRLSPMWVRQVPKYSGE